MSESTTTEIAARLAAATPGPWAAYDWQKPAWVGSEYSYTRVVIRKPVVSTSGAAQGSADTEFIAHAPADIEFLLARVNELEKQRAEAIAECQAIDTETNEALQGYLASLVVRSLGGTQ